MKINDVNEIVNADGEIISSNNDEPVGGSNAETRANGTTDDNVSISHQPFRYDMLGRFGFTMMPFFENDDDNNLRNDIAELINNHFMDIIEYYVKNPNKLKNDYKKLKNVPFDEQDDEIRTNTMNWVDKIMDVLKNEVGSSLDDLNENLREFSINENEGTLVKKQKLSDDEINLKKKDHELVDNQIKKIAGLINKTFNTDNKDKLRKLLEDK